MCSDTGSEVVHWGLPLPVSTFLRWHRPQGLGVRMTKIVGALLCLRTATVSHE